MFLSGEVQKALLKQVANLSGKCVVAKLGLVAGPFRGNRAGSVLVREEDRVQPCHRGLRAHLRMERRQHDRNLRQDVLVEGVSAEELEVLEPRDSGAEGVGAKRFWFGSYEGMYCNTPEI